MVCKMVLKEIQNGFQNFTLTADWLILVLILL